MELLLTRIKRGDHQAFKELFELYHKKVYRFATRFADDDQADDIVQDVFIHIWKTRHAIKEDVKLDALLFNTSKQQLSNWYRKHREEPLDEDSIPAAEEYEEQDATHHLAARKKILSQCVNRLPPRRREVFTLYHHEGLSYQEIAQYLNISISAVGNHLYLASEFLREQTQSYRG
ncbi:RNA polymerase sigma factor [Sphingobacterium griseoflavum]|uniref:DNA-directed RNA polymerase sigma-70 factor n=1 Tax=Sphingobacterium griseoflavum TaxID=1474952 RepID=A0ABQ3HRL6_9SPHI|nr:sigma-70 family RNA polymerase sigma factor [Sphingobacterium griseoflavum]GHE28604.1 DNA-directed RNA polymerase sigma-70 factor [Sphingobacterium griseoflavum]